MKRIALFILIAAVAVSTADAQEITRTKQKEKNGFKWILLEQGDYKGAETKKGKELIPLEKQFKNIKYDNDFFVAEAAGAGYSVYTRKGKQIIESRSIQSVNCFEASQGFIYCKDGGYKVLYDTTGKIIIPKDRKYNTIIIRDGCIYVYEKYDPRDDLQRIVGVCDFQGNVIIPTSRGYNRIWRKHDKGEYWYEIYKDGKGGICDIYGDEIIEPSVPSGHYIIYHLERTFAYSDDSDEEYVKHYLGMTLDADGHGVPDPKHPVGTTRLKRSIKRQTAENRTTAYSTYEPVQTYTPSNPTSAKTSTTSKPSSNTTSTTTQPKSTPEPEKCKSCLGSGQCRGYGSVQSIKMHCNASGRCSTCGGRGLMSTGFGSQTKCSYCNGSGKCQYCKGTGKCDRCNGTGTRKY